MIIALRALVLLLESSVLLSQHRINGVYIHYNTTAGPVEGKLNVYLVRHYVGSNDSLQVLLIPLFKHQALFYINRFVVMPLNEMHLP